MSGLARNLEAEEEGTVEEKSHRLRVVVEVDGIEPTTSSLQS